MVEWLEHLAVVGKVAGSSPALTVHPAANRYLINFREGQIWRKGKNFTPPFTCRVQGTMWILQPIAPTANRLGGPLLFAYLYLKCRYLYLKFIFLYSEHPSRAKSEQRKLYGRTCDFLW